MKATNKMRKPPPSKRRKERSGGVFEGRGGREDRAQGRKNRHRKKDFFCEPPTPVKVRRSGEGFASMKLGRRRCGKDIMRKEESSAASSGTIFKKRAEGTT